MNAGEAWKKACKSLKVHKAVEYVKHIAKFKDGGFGWNREDIFDEIHAVMAYYGLWVDTFSKTEIYVLKHELLELLELEEKKEILRLAEIEA